MDILGGSARVVAAEALRHTQYNLRKQADGNVHYSVMCNINGSCGA
jgi:hypothetical protein